MYHLHMRCLINGRKLFTRIVVSRTAFPCHFVLWHWSQCFCFQLASHRIYFYGPEANHSDFSGYFSITLSAYHGKRWPKPSSSNQFSLFLIHRTLSPTHLTLSYFCNWENGRRKLSLSTSLSDKMLQAHIISRLHKVSQFKFLIF
jgi:hypothetical protein